MTTPSSPPRPSAAPGAHGPAPSSLQARPRPRPPVPLRPVADDGRPSRDGAAFARGATVVVVVGTTAAVVGGWVGMAAGAAVAVALGLLEHRWDRRRR